MGRVNSLFIYTLNTIENYLYSHHHKMKMQISQQLYNVVCLFGDTLVFHSG